MNGKVSFERSLEDGCVDVIVHGKNYALSPKKMVGIIDFLLDSLSEITDYKQQMEAIKNTVGEE